ncbi:MAG: hypothetical protein J6J86_05615 [Lachnospiraceae bacterium]|nr:hypothetical protein [Lachnospiraceae bacterium]
MRFPTLFALFVTFLVWLAYKLRKSDHTDASFWKRENEANNVRKQNLDNLDYITIPLDSLPFFSGIDEKLDDIQQTLQNLASKTIVNLSRYTNTDLKFMYGAGNLAALTEYDQNFTLLVRTLHKWSEQLIALGYENEAIRVLEYAVSIKSDVTADYVLLAKLYQKRHTPEKLDSLIQSASALDTLLKDSLVKQLKALKENA